MDGGISLEWENCHLWEFPDGVSQRVAPPRREDGGREGHGDGADAAARLGRGEVGEAQHLVLVQAVAPGDDEICEIIVKMRLKSSIIIRPIW